MEQIKNKFSECRVHSTGDLCSISLRQSVKPSANAEQALRDLNCSDSASCFYFLNGSVLESKATLLCEKKPTLPELIRYITGMIADMRSTIMIVEKGDDQDE
jgi:hypothetical protein